MKSKYRIIICLLVSLLSAVGLSSCLWTQVRTHTLTDAIGKQVYEECTRQNPVSIYRRNGVYYVQHVFYKVPARGVLCTRSILRKGGCTDHIYLSGKPEYREGMETYCVYIAWPKEVMSGLLPGRTYKEAASGECALPQSCFTGCQPVAVITDSRKLEYLPRLSKEASSAERSVANYALMPLTGALYVSDAALSVMVTTAGWVGFNLPLVTLGTLYCWIVK